MDKRKKIKEKYEEVFTPGAPIDNKKMLFGRDQEYNDLINAIKRKGEHAIIIGDRGVGKTSLVKTVLRQLKDECGLISSIRTCDPFSSYNMVFENLIRDIGFDTRKIESSSECTSQHEVKANVSILSGGLKAEDKQIEKHIPNDVKITPWEVFNFFKNNENKYILVLDEYDAVHLSENQKEFHTSTAYTIKTFADNSDICSSKIIIVGVSQSSDDLIGKHISIERNLKEIYLRPIKKAHIHDYLSYVEDFLEIKIDDLVKKDIVESSLGYPYFFHLVGLESIEAMLNRNDSELIVKMIDYNKAIERATNQAFQAELSKYKSIFFDKSSNEDERNLLITLSSVSEYPTPRTVLKKYCDKYKFDKPFEEILINLIQDRRVIHLSKSLDNIRFYDPLLRPFVRKFYKIGNYPRPKEGPTLFDAM